MGEENVLTNSAYIVLNICTLNYSNDATTFSLLTFSIMTLSVMDLITTLSIRTEYHYAECQYSKCRVLFLLCWTSLCRGSLCRMSWPHLNYLKGSNRLWVVAGLVVMRAYRGQLLKGQQNQIFAEKMDGRAGNPYWSGRLSTVDHLILTSLDQLLFTFEVSLTLFTKQDALTRRFIKQQMI
jgi:hypothetical protein